MNVKIAITDKVGYVYKITMARSTVEPNPEFFHNQQ